MGRGVQPTRIMRTQDKDARALEGQAGAFRTGRAGARMPGYPWKGCPSWPCGLTALRAEGRA
eukprot:2541143-Pyramimonas_sp.AAC.1